MKKSYNFLPEFARGSQNKSGGGVRATQVDIVRLLLVEPRVIAKEGLLNFYGMGSGDLALLAKSCQHRTSGPALGCNHG